MDIPIAEWGNTPSPLAGGPYRAPVPRTAFSSRDSIREYTAGTTTGVSSVDETMLQREVFP